MRITLILFVIIFFYSCDINNQKLLIVNSTSNTIYYSLLIDTTLNSNICFYEVPPLDSVWPSFVFGGEGAWEYKINSHSKDSTLHIFLTKKNVITNNIISNHEYDRLDYKVDALNKLNWRIVIK